MAVTDALLFSLQLLLIVAFIGKNEVLGDEDVCQDKNVQHFVAFLEEEHVKKVGVNLSKLYIFYILKKSYALNFFALALIGNVALSLTKIFVHSRSCKKMLRL